MYCTYYTVKEIYITFFWATWPAINIYLALLSIIKSFPVTPVIHVLLWPMTIIRYKISHNQSYEMQPEGRTSFIVTYDHNTTLTLSRVFFLSDFIYCLLAFCHSIHMG